MPTENFSEELASYVDACNAIARERDRYKVALMGIAAGVADPKKVAKQALTILFDKLDNAENPL